jgi:hypothetical protein
MKLHMALFLYTLASTQVSQSVAPTLTADVLSSDRVAIYREFLISDPALAAVPATSTLNVSLVTEPFVYKDFVDPDRSCLGAAHIFELSTPQLHKVPAEVSASDRVRLVDLSVPPPAAPVAGHSVGAKALGMFHRAAAGPPAPVRPDSLLTLSEIVFDDSHSYAAFRYSYSSTRDFAKGATAMYELDHGTWKAAKSNCSEWNR